MDFIFERKINYYETDKMGVVHHSNYIRYMEEARCAWLESIGMPFSVLEENGKVNPTKLNAFVFDQFQNGYYKIGEKVGQAWKSGEKFMNK